MIDPYTQQLAQLKGQNDIGRAWASFVYDQWLPQQLKKLGGPAGYAGPDMGAFSSVLRNPVGAEQGAAQGLYGSIVGGAADQGGIMPNPHYGRLGNLAQLAFSTSMEKDYRDRAQALEAERSGAMQQAQQHAYDLGLQLWQAGVPPAQIETAVQGYLGSSGFQFPQGTADFAQSAFATPFPQQGAQLDAEDRQAIWSQVQQGLQAGLPLHAIWQAVTGPLGDLYNQHKAEIDNMIDQAQHAYFANPGTYQSYEQTVDPQFAAGKEFDPYAVTHAGISAQGQSPMTLDQLKAFFQQLAGSFGYGG